MTGDVLAVFAECGCELAATCDPAKIEAIHASLIRIHQMTCGRDLDLHTPPAPLILSA